MRIDASCTENTPAGIFLGNMYYHGVSALDVFTGNEKYGFLSDGGRHTLVLFNVSKEDVDAFLQLVHEVHSGSRGCDEFIATVRTRMN